MPIFLLFLLLAIVIVPLAWGIVTQILTRRKANKSITIDEKGNITGIDTSNADEVTFSLPLHKYSSMLITSLVISILICIGGIVALFTFADYDDMVCAFISLGLFFFVWCVYGMVCGLFRQDRLRFDKEGMHISEPVIESFSKYETLCLAIITLVFVGMMGWLIYTQITQMKVEPIAPIFFIVIHLAVAALVLFKLKKSRRYLIVKSGEVNYDSEDKKYLYNTIEWKEIERVEYQVKRNLLSNQSFLKVLFKREKYDPIYLMLNEYFRLSETSLAISRFDHRVYEPLATLCKAHGVRFLLTK